VLGPNSIGVSPDASSTGCGPNALSGSSDTQNACSYNGPVKLGSSTYTPHSCAAAWYSAVAQGTGGSAVLGPACYPGTSFLYAHANGCSRYSPDMRLSTYPNGPGVHKCSKLQVGSRYAQADDLWGAMSSTEHDPCGWPFLECIADCSLPSNPAAKGWSVNGAGEVWDPVQSKVVGCTDTPCVEAKKMRDPRSANRIAAM
jgi:hypothetical protein